MTTESTPADSATLRRLCAEYAKPCNRAASLQLLNTLPPIEILVPPPGQAAPVRRAPGNDAKLERVRTALVDQGVGRHA